MKEYAKNIMRGVAGIGVGLLLTYGVRSCDKAKYPIHIENQPKIQIQVKNTQKIDDEYTPEEKKYMEALVAEQIGNFQKRHIKGKLNLRKLIDTVSNYSKDIDEGCRKYDIPEVIAFGLFTLENGGDIDNRSKRGCVGLGQISFLVGRHYGIVKTKKIHKKEKIIEDGRNDPKKNMDVSLHYLSDLYGKYGDWALAVQAYQSGEGNINKSIKRYLHSKGKKVRIVNKNIIDKYNIEWPDIMRNRHATKHYTNKLNCGINYVPKVLAMAEYYKNQQIVER